VRRRLSGRGGPPINGQAVPASPALRDRACLGRVPSPVRRNGDQEAIACAGFSTSITQASKWGNPFRIGRDGDRAAVIARYERWLADQHHLLRALDELRGRDLVCFCAPRPCQGDLLLRLANATREERIAW
jgi:hypothetical protein